jgi:hypothetical protein
VTDAERQELAALVQEIERREQARFRQFFPDAGPFARDQYLKQIEFFDAGARFKERLFMAANRVGKSEAGAYEVTCHLTWEYPAWWTGRRFDHPVEVWASGTNSQTTRDIVQAKLLGSRPSAGDGDDPRASHHENHQRSGTPWRCRKRGDSTCVRRDECPRDQELRAGAAIV